MEADWNQLDGTGTEEIGGSASDTNVVDHKYNHHSSHMYNNFPYIPCGLMQGGDERVQMERTIVGTSR